MNIFITLALSLITAGIAGFTFDPEFAAQVTKKTPEPIASPSPTATPTPTEVPTPTTTPKPTTPKTLGVQIQATVAPTKATVQTGGALTASDRMATPGEIFGAVNSYRNAHGLGSLSSSGTLCAIASTRANQQAQAGHLDHGGFEGQAKSQTEFHHVAEILQYTSVPATASYLVNTGWAGSPQHNGQMLGAQWTHGCAATAGFYAVFVFAYH
jgi:uncharacterized protein YkwD